MEDSADVPGKKKRKNSGILEETRANDSVILFKKHDSRRCEEKEYK